MQAYMTVIISHLLLAHFTDKGIRELFPRKNIIPDFTVIEETTPIKNFSMDPILHEF